MAARGSLDVRAALNSNFRAFQSFRDRIPLGKGSSMVLILVVNSELYAHVQLLFDLFKAFD